MCILIYLSTTIEHVYNFFLFKGLNTIKIGTLVVYYVSYHNLQIIIYNQNDTVSVFDYFCKALTVFH